MSYNVVSGIQQGESVIYVYPLFFRLLPCRSLQSTVGFLVLYSRSILVICFIHIVCICQCQSPNFSIPLLTILLTVFFFSTSVTLLLSYKFICPIFLDFTYVIWYLSFSDWLTSFMIFSMSIQLLQMVLFCSFYCWVIFHCKYVPHLYLFLCRWTFMLLPCSAYCKQCCNIHWGACTFLNYSFFLLIYAQEWD